MFFSVLSYQEIILLMTSLLFSLTVHEYSHARAAYSLGDFTAFYRNRMNLNPLNHLDLFGTMALLFIGFGWAKPVPVDLRNLKNPRRDMFLVAMAGPASNFLLAFLGSLIFNLNFLFGISFFAELIRPLEYFIYVNIMLGIFNLLPLHPLDGSRVIPLIIKNPTTLMKFQENAPKVFFILIFMNILSPPFPPILGYMIGYPSQMVYFILTGSFFSFGG